MGIIKPLEEFSSYSDSFRLIDHENPKFYVRSLFKYMDLETAIICLKNKSIRFVQPSEWPDKYERHFYNADYSNVTNDIRVTPRIWACCFTTNKMSEASWNTYRYGKNGLGNKCVKFQLSRTKFRAMLRKDKRFLYTVEGLMNYSLSDYDIQHIHLKSSQYYNQIFMPPFTIDKYLSLLLIKRSAFNYENEFRFMVASRTLTPDTPQIFVKVDWSSLIEKVEIDKDATDIEIEILKKYLEVAGVTKDVIENTKRVKLYDDPSEKVIIE